MTRTGPASLWETTGAMGASSVEGPIANESNLENCAGDALVLDVDASLLLVDKGSLIINPEGAALLDAAAFSGLVFSLPGISAPDPEGNDVSMGEDSGMETSLRRPPVCEPAPVGLLEESRTLISVPDYGSDAGSSVLGPPEECATGGEELLFEVDVPATAPVVDCSAGPSAIGRLFRGAGCGFLVDDTPPVRVYCAAPADRLFQISEPRYGQILQLSWAGNPSRRRLFHAVWDN